MRPLPISRGCPFPFFLLALRASVPRAQFLTMSLFPPPCLLSQVIKNEDIMRFAGKWMEGENIILSEVTQTPKDMHGMYSAYILIHLKPPTHAI